ncbi:MAG: hypothetical protein KDI61_00230 [Alphaproteobacteria bacterium]|nr:hypothetical protein [Alphaproteobacteria bacterium]
MKLLTLIFMGIGFSAPTLACDVVKKYEVTLRKHDHQSGDCTSLELTFPKTVDFYSKPQVTLQYEEGKDRLMQVTLQIEDLDKNDNYLSSSVCLTDELMKRASIGIAWTYYEKIERSAFCGPSIVIQNLYELLESGGITTVKPSIE